MSYLESPKQYTGNSLDTIFFRPMMTGPSAQDLGVRILYNMPVPTTVQLWDGQRNILQPFTAAGWTGGSAATKYEKTIGLHRVKAEMGISAADYFSLVYETISARADVNMQDLSGTILEEAETALFRQALAENIRATMWVGNTAQSSGYNTFNGFLPLIKQFALAEMCYADTVTDASLNSSPDAILNIFDTLWNQADPRLQSAKADGQLAFFVSSDLYYRYEKYLDTIGAETAYAGTVDGRQSLSYHGIPVIDVRLGNYLEGTSLDKSFCLFTDRRNLVLAVNTADTPGNEVRMWYNPDQMENRQRAVFMAGCEILDEHLIGYISVTK